MLFKKFNVKEKTNIGKVLIKLTTANKFGKLPFNINYK